MKIWASDYLTNFFFDIWETGRINNHRIVPYRKRYLDREYNLAGVTLSVPKLWKLINLLNTLDGSRTICMFCNVLRYFSIYQ